MEALQLGDRCAMVLFRRHTTVPLSLPASGNNDDQQDFGEVTPAKEKVEESEKLIDMGHPDKQQRWLQIFSSWKWIVAVWISLTIAFLFLSFWRYDFSCQSETHLPPLQLPRTTPLPTGHNELEQNSAAVYLTDVDETLQPVDEEQAEQTSPTPPTLQIRAYVEQEKHPNADVRALPDDLFGWSPGEMGLGVEIMEELMPAEEVMRKKAMYQAHAFEVRMKNYSFMM